MRSLHEFVAALKSEHRGIRREAEEDPADRLVMRLAPLGLLGGGVHVAEAALERAVVENRRRAGAGGFYAGGPLGAEGGNSN